jgi:hypothetical protein
MEFMYSEKNKNLLYLKVIFLGFKKSWQTTLTVGHVEKEHVSRI